MNTRISWIVMFISILNIINMLIAWDNLLNGRYCYPQKISMIVLNLIIIANIYWVLTRCLAQCYYLNAVVLFNSHESYEVLLPVKELSN